MASEEKKETRGRPKGAKDTKPRKPRRRLVRQLLRDPSQEPLSHMEWLAVEHYMRGESKRDALMKAGYSETTANAQALRVFGRERVQKEIDRRRAVMTKTSNAIVDRVQEELARIAFFNIGHFLCVDEDGNFIYDWTEASMDDLAAIGEVSIETYKEGKGRDASEVKRVKVKPYDKKAALDSLARIHGMFRDSLNLTADGESLESRLARGRNRVAKGVTVDGEVEGVSRDTENA